MKGSAAALLLTVGWTAAVAAGSAARAPSAAANAYDLPIFAPSTAPITVAGIIEKFKGYDARMETLSADFTEELDNSVVGSTQSVSGAFKYKKPEFFRMEETAPGPQLAVADGKDLWIWRQESNQVIKTKISDWRKQDPMAQSFLEIGNYGKMLDEYDVRIEAVSAPDGAGYRDVTLRLSHKKKRRRDDFALTLAFSTRDYFPAKVEIDGEGISLSSKLSHIRYNIPMPSGAFKFVPPEGADVFDASASQDSDSHGQ